MSHENVEVTVKQFEVTNAGDIAGLMDRWAEDVTLIIHGEAWERSPLGDTATGKVAVAALWWDWGRQFGPDYRFDIEELLPPAHRWASRSLRRRLSRPARDAQGGSDGG